MKAMVMKMKINVHGGHAKAGNKYCGAVGLLNESKEDRLVASKLSTYLKKGGATVYGCTVSSGSSQTNVLEKICKKCNKHSVDKDVSVHFNSGRKDKRGDGKVGGFEVWVRPPLTDEKKETAKRMCKAMEGLGFANRGIKTNENLYYLNHTKAPAYLLETCFVDDKDDYLLYKTVGCAKIGKALAEAILDKEIGTTTTDRLINPFKTGAKVKIQKGAVYGGASSGKKVGSAYIGKKYTVKKVQTNNNQMEALIKELNSWVPTKYLTIV